LLVNRAAKATKLTSECQFIHKETPMKIVMKVLPALFWAGCCALQVYGVITHIKDHHLLLIAANGLAAPLFAWLALAALGLVQRVDRVWFALAALSLGFWFANDMSLQHYLAALISAAMMLICLLFAFRQPQETSN
jgi:hypothetical protein